MTSRRHFMTIGFGLLAGFWFGPVAFAAPPQVDDAHNPAIARASVAVNWDTIKWVERRYKIEALRFKARDETGIDWLGSDEVMIETRDAKGWTVSNTIGDIDSGDTHTFDPAKSCIVAVRPGYAVLGESSVCEDVGEPAPLGFDVAFWEKDPFGFPAGFCGPGTPQPGRHGGPHCANDGNGDDFIGSARVDYSTQALEAALPNVGDQQIESITLDSCPGQICTSDSDYTLTWRVTRLPDALVGLRDLLDQAMKRSGAGSELEAIAAGLRSLSAKPPADRSK